jgi:uncharacterized repeat protein (TIGR01451 family)
MKLIFVTGFLLLIIGEANSQTDKYTKGPIITWDKSMHDFGDIIQGEKVEYTFKLTNTGDQPLIITNVEVTCGCTVPKGWPRDPIAPDESAEITISFNSTGKSGKQNKVISIISNSKGVDNQIIFSANVIQKNELN